jgi:hypothetical protein
MNFQARPASLNARPRDSHIWPRPACGYGTFRFSEFGSFRRVQICRPGTFTSGVLRPASDHLAGCRTSVGLCSNANMPARPRSYGCTATGTADEVASSRSRPQLLQMQLRASLMRRSRAHERFR